MLYQWSNSQILSTLVVKGGNEILSFETQNEKATVYFKDNDIEKVVFKTNEIETEISKSERHEIVVGEGNSKRDVFHFLKPGGPAPQMRLGITKHIGKGTWSSLPHDFELNLEPDFEEVFFYLLEGGSKVAFQRGKGVWCNNDKVDDGWIVKDKTFSTVPMGYHPVVGEPGVQVAYIWVYLCKKPEWEKI
mgnify:CR=1 FL=1